MNYFSYNDYADCIENRKFYRITKVEEKIERYETKNGIVQEHSKKNKIIKILSNETGRKPRLSIRMFRKGENVKYRKFICDLDYQSADNDLVMNNIEPSTSSIVVRFKHDLTKNMKFTFSIENVGL